MYEAGFRTSVEGILKKLGKKNPKQLEVVLAKIDEICMEPHRYKNLRKPLNSLKRVHIDSSFVLVFSVDEEEQMVIIEDYDHHDKIYQKKKR